MWNLSASAHSPHKHDQLIKATFISSSQVSCMCYYISVTSTGTSYFTDKRWHYINPQLIIALLWMSQQQINIIGPKGDHPRCFCTDNNHIIMIIEISKTKGIIAQSTGTSLKVPNIQLHYLQYWLFAAWPGGNRCCLGHDRHDKDPLRL